MYSGTPPYSSSSYTINWSLYDDHTTCTQTKKQSVVIFSVKLVKKTIIFIFALPVLEDLQDVNIFQF